MADHQGTNGFGQGIPPASNVHTYPKWLIILARFFSVIFHPLFLPLYIVGWLLYLDTYFFTGFDRQEKLRVFAQVLVNMVLFPALTVLLLRALGFNKSIFLKTQKERIVPYISCGIFFFWMYLVFRNAVQIPRIMVSFSFGVFIAASLALIANIYYKISMHAIGAGGMMGFLIAILYSAPEAVIALPLSIGAIITGIICTSRLIVSNHSQKEVYMGLLLGFACQVFSGFTML